MIPKIIHYCWFGRNPLPTLAIKCIESWKKYCPDYKIIEWNEDNFDVNQNLYCKQAYESKKWAFVSDYARLKIIYDHGGIYLDTDVEIIKPLDDLLNYDFYAGYEESGSVNTGLGFGGCVQNKCIALMLDEYTNIGFYKADNKLDLTPCPIRNTEGLSKFGFEIDFANKTIDNNQLFDKSYFSPFEYATGKIVIQDTTYSIHHFHASWKDDNTYIEQRRRLRRILMSIFGKKLGLKVANLFIKLLKIDK